MTIIASCGQVRHITVDPFGRVFEVTNLFDKFGEPTLDPVLASTCVIMLSDGAWLPQDANDVPIYTVH
jgi:hypothetical protein